MNVSVEVEKVSIKGSGAWMSGPYRYQLWRIWGLAPRALFVMLNPSTADQDADDPTIRKCVHYAKAVGAGGLEVVNLFAWRATDPKELLRATEPVGPSNDVAIAQAVARAGMVIAAWGELDSRPPWFRQRAYGVLQGLRASHDVAALKVTKGGHPGHPLYLPNSARPTLYRARRTAA